MISKQIVFVSSTTTPLMIRKRFYATSNLYLLCSDLFSAMTFVQQVVDESDGCGGKFNVVIVSSEFEGKSLLQRHRLVNTTLAEELKTIHAFSQKNYTPEQWAKEQSN